MLDAMIDCFKTRLRFTENSKMSESDNDKIFDDFYSRRPRSGNLVSVNYCIPGFMSRCSAGLIWQDQKKCKYAIKSTVKDRCMHFVESIDGHCDSVHAQRKLNHE